MTFASEWWSPDHACCIGVVDRFEERLPSGSGQNKFLCTHSKRLELFDIIGPGPHRLFVGCIQSKNVTDALVLDWLLNLNYEMCGGHFHILL